MRGFVMRSGQMQAPRLPTVKVGRCPTTHVQSRSPNLARFVEGLRVLGTATPAFESWQTPGGCSHGVMFVTLVNSQIQTIRVSKILSSNVISHWTGLNLEQLVYSREFQNVLGINKKPRCIQLAGLNSPRDFFPFCFTYYNWSWLISLGMGWLKWPRQYLVRPVEVGAHGPAGLFCVFVWHELPDPRPSYFHLGKWRRLIANPAGMGGHLLYVGSILGTSGIWYRDVEIYRGWCSMQLSCNSDTHPLRPSF